MPWYSPWSDHIAKSVCKYLLQRYLGQFLEEKLTLDQLTVDLYKGIGVISDVALDVQALNEVAEQQNIPFEFTDGFIEKMSVSVPWSSILSEATNIQVEGLSLTVKKTERDKTRASMIESMWSSMTSSLQLAEDCLKKERDSSTEEGGHTFEGIESFAHTIDSILSKIKVKFYRTVIRLEEISDIHQMGVAFEISIKLIEYFDEAAADEPEIEANVKQNLSQSSFSAKKVYLEGVTLFSDEFPVSSMSNSNSSLTHDNKYQQIEGNPKAMEQQEIGERNIQVGHFAGRQEVTLNFKQEGLEGPKVDLNVSLGALTVFLSPHQTHGLFDLISGMTSSTQCSRIKTKNQCSQKPMEEADFLRIEQELQVNLNQPTTGLQIRGITSQGWANTCLDGSEYEFTPVHNSSRLNESVISSTGSLSSSFMSTSSKSSCQNSYYQPKRKTNSGNVESDPNAIVCQFRVILSSLTVVLLHEDILTTSAEACKNNVAHSSYEEMQTLANEFFEKLGRHVASGYGSKDFEKAKEVFSSICQLNHIRLTAAPVIIEGSETSTTHASLIKGKCTASNLEIFECLFEKGGHSQRTTLEIVELLKFKKFSGDAEKNSTTFSSPPNLILNFRLPQVNSCAERSRKSSQQSKSDFAFVLQPFETEIDVTIINRISALLNPESLSSRKTNSYVLTSSILNPFSKEHIQRVVDSSPVPNSKQNIKLTSPFITFKIRFPIPDLRPSHDMDKPPWWKRSVRKDIIYLDVTDLIMHTVLCDLDPFTKFEIQFRDIVAKFKDSDLEQPTEFLRGSTSSNCDSLGNGEAGFGWPRLVVQIYPKMNKSSLEECDVPASHFSSNLGYHSLVSALENAARKENSPFSCKKVIHESDTPHGKTSSSEQDGEELIVPGDSVEMADFIDVASLNTRVKLDITLPVGSLVLLSKHMYEVIYNRISNDLLLWEPSAPLRSDYLRNAQYEHPADDFMPVFNLCKSTGQGDSDSDSESQHGVFYSVYEQKQSHKKKQMLENNSMMGQSKVVLKATVIQGMCNLYAPVRDSQGNVIPRQHGHLNIAFDEGNLFLVSGYKGKSDLDYFCVQVNHFSFYHNGLVSDSIERPLLQPVGSVPPSHLELTVKKTEKCALIDQSTSVGVGSSKSLDMLTVAVRVQKQRIPQPLKLFRVAIGVREATLRHKVVKGPSTWFTQLIDFFDVSDYPIAGYDPSSVLSEINVHLWNCCVDYRPLHLPMRSLLTIGNFNISSNITAQTSSSTLRFIAEDAAFFLSDKVSVRFPDSPADLRNEYVCVMDLGLFELSLRLSEKGQVNPKVDLRASANVVHLWTCSDSAKALTDLLMYFASDADLNGFETGKEDSKQSSMTVKSDGEDQVLVKTEDTESVHSLSKSQMALVNDMMEEAMKESKILESSKEKPGKKIYFERRKGDEVVAKEEEMNKFSLGSELVTEGNQCDFDDRDESWENEFCIVQNEAGMGIMPKKGLPEVRNLINAPVRLVDNHFSIPLGKADLLQSPKHYPKPVLRYMLREMSLVWHIYGGSDFDANDPPGPAQMKENDGLSGETVVAFSRDSLTDHVNFKRKSEGPMDWRHRGGPKRRHDVLMELQLNKVRFQHEIYPENTTEASRQVLLIQDVELRDRLATSTINKFLYQYSSESKPKQSQAPMVVVKSVLMRTDPKVNAQECCLKVSLLPLRLNIDQDSILFLYKFFTELSCDSKEEDDDGGSKSPTPKHQVPVMTVDVKGISNPVESTAASQPLLIDLDEENQNKKKNNLNGKRKDFVLKNKASSQPVFFRCFIFSPEVPVKLDYQGKRVDMSHGSLAGILMGLGQLNNSELKLRKISHRHGLLGFDKLMNFVLTEWANDIKKNQLPSLLGGVGPMHSLVQLSIRDLFWLPIEQYQKDGRLVRGFQRGANSFTTSTAMASLELISRLIQIIQMTAETAYDMVSPGPSVKTACRPGKGKPKRYSQPADIREGMAIAYLVVKEGIGETAETLMRVASKEHEQKGVTGAVGGVLRQIPPTVVKPIILATEATNNVIGGMRSQLVPDARKEAADKWRKQES